MNQSSGKLYKHEKFYLACRNGNLEFIQTYIKEKHFPKKDIKFHYNRVLFYASLYNYINILHYFLTSPDLKKYVDIHQENDDILITAATQGHLHIVEYLLTSPHLKEHADIHAQNDLALLNAAKRGYIDIIEFLVSSNKLKKHADLNILTEQICDIFAWKWIKIKQEENNLKIKNLNSKKIKTKIL